MREIALIDPFFQANLQFAIIGSAAMATIVIVAASLFVHLLKRLGASAAARSQVWATLTLCLVLMPIASQLMPAWNLPLMTAPITIGRFVGAAGTAVESPPAATTSDWSLPFLGSNTLATESSPEAWSAARVGPWIVWLWMVGFAVVGCVTLLGWLSLVRLRMRTSRVCNHALIHELEILRRRIGISGAVSLLVSDRRAIPMAWGLLRPTIHLPSNATGWSEAGRRAVMLHELAHLRRRDYLFCLLARMACAMYWFNPLVWYVLRKLRDAQESACDDIVLEHGISPTSYVDQLMRVIVGQRWESALALGAGRANSLRRRVDSILDGTFERRPPARWQAALNVTIVGAAAVAAASAGPLQHDVDQDANPGVAVTTYSDGNPVAFFDALASKSSDQLQLSSLAPEEISRALQGLGDVHARYIPPEELALMREQVRGQMSGIGAQLKSDDGRTAIEFPLSGSPAERSGLQAGDIIVSIDGRPAVGLPLAEVIERIRGPVGSVVSLAVQREGSARELLVTRGTIPLRSVHGIRGVRPDPGMDERFMVSPDDGIAYFHLSKVSNKTPDELHKMLRELSDKGLRGAILDLRFCPGGALQGAVDVADLFLRSGDVAMIRGWDGSEVRLRATHKATADFPLVVIINGQTASAAEVVVAALQDNDRATVIGTRTQGKGSVQSLLPIDEDQGAVRLTTATYFPPSGRNIDRKPGSKFWGIDADDGYVVPVTASQLQMLQRQMQAHPAATIPAEMDTLTPANIRTWFGDPQFAAALETLQAKLRRGQGVEGRGSRVEG